MPTQWKMLLLKKNHSASHPYAEPIMLQIDKKNWASRHSFTQWAASLWYFSQNVAHGVLTNKSQTHVYN